MSLQQSKTFCRLHRVRLGAGLILATGLASGGGCTWVKVSEEAAQVNLVPASRVADCRKLGSASTSVKASVAGISRSREKVLSELDALARQEAIQMGANTLVREAAEDDSASYSAYICP